MRNLIKISVLFLSLAGCTHEQQMAAAAGAQAAAQQADFNARAKELLWCNTLTSGAEHRVYGPYKQKMAARNIICWPDLTNEQPPEVVVTPLAPQHHEHPAGVPVL
jgi:hypothetical protein